MARHTVRAAALGQLLALLIAATAVCSTLLAREVSQLSSVTVAGPCRQPGLPAAAAAAARHSPPPAANVPRRQVAGPALPACRECRHPRCRAA